MLSLVPSPEHANSIAKSPSWMCVSIIAGPVLLGRAYLALQRSLRPGRSDSLYLDDVPTFRHLRPAAFRPLALPDMG